ncbi:MAG: hypothetical protein LBS82_00110 [Spirochaetaceae bacterium]|jgi:hypothetical protein|nr:hypothetical protein [Spirochaetaceae bacterium]
MGYIPRPDAEFAFWAEGDGAELDLANRKRALMRRLAAPPDWDAAAATRIYSARVARGDRDW